MWAAGNVRIAGNDTEAATSGSIGLCALKEAAGLVSGRARPRG
jgi:hypothetical protein